MKKFILLALLLAGISTVAFAGPNFPREDDNMAGFVNVGAAYTAVDAVAVGRPALVYAITAYADAASTHCDIYNATSAPANGVKPQIEVGEATQFRTTRNQYTPPLNFTTGVYIDATAGSCYVEYR